MDPKGPQHPLSGQTVKLLDEMHDPMLNGEDFVVEDWWTRVVGESWMTSTGNPAALRYAARSVAADLPIDDAVVYGKVHMLGHIVHSSEIVEEG